MTCARAALRDLHALVRRRGLLPSLRPEERAAHEANGTHPSLSQNRTVPLPISRPP